MWILATLLGILLVVILILCVPVDLIMHAERQEYFRWRLRVGWLFGRVGKDIKSHKDHPIAEDKPKKSRIGRIAGIKNVRGGADVRGFASGLFNYAKDLFRLIDVRELVVHVRAGAGDPADTAVLLGPAALAVRWANQRSSLWDVRIDPDFEQEIFCGHFRMNVRIIPIRVIGRSLRFWLSPTTIRVMWAARRARR